MTNTPWTNRSYINGLKNLLPKSPLKDRKDFDKVVSGQVVDADGLPLPGVTILVEGSTYGTQTDFDGYYSIKVRNGERLRFSYAGYHSASEYVSSRKNLDVQLKENASALDEVVVTAQGLKREKQTLGAAVYGSLADEEMLAEPTAGISTAMVTGQG